MFTTQSLSEKLKIATDEISRAGRRSADYAVVSPNFIKILEKTLRREIIKSKIKKMYE